MKTFWALSTILVAVAFTPLPGSCDGYWIPDTRFVDTLQRLAEETGAEFSKPGSPYASSWEKFGWDAKNHDAIAILARIPFPDCSQLERIEIVRQIGAPGKSKNDSFVVWLIDENDHALTILWDNFFESIFAKKAGFVAGSGAMPLTGYQGYHPVDFRQEIGKLIEEAEEAGTKRTWETRIYGAFNIALCAAQRGLHQQSEDLLRAVMRKGPAALDRIAQRNAKFYAEPHWILVSYDPFQKAVDLHWTPVAGATEYQILRGADKSELVGTDSTTGTRHIDRTTEPGKMYWYAIQALTGARSESRTGAMFVRVPVPKPIAPEPPKAVSGSKNKAVTTSEKSKDLTPPR